MSHDDHGHDHSHDAITTSGEPAVAARVRALEELLLEKGVLEREELRERIDWLVSRTPSDGARLVARAWLDEDFKRRLLADAREAALDLDLDPGPSPRRHRTREHRDRAPHGRLHALLVLSESVAWPSA